MRTHNVRPPAHAAAALETNASLHNFAPFPPEASFSQKFKIQRFTKAPADRYYPVAHTCFFTLELPAYSSAKLMRERLRYAIHNCEVRFP
jgi:hypothetical protein